MSEGRDALVIGSADQLWQAKTRRDFLRLLGVGGSVVLLPSLFACDDDDDNGTGGDGTPVVLNLGTDTGILNYAYALEQLEAAFYTAVVANTSVFNSMTAEQQEVMVDLRNHEVIHREFFRQVLGAANRIPDLALNASTVTAVTANAATVLKTAEMFEDLGVAAYNGAGKYLTSADNLLVAGKIVSVEARHAAAIRDLREGLSLAGTPAFTRFAGDDVVNTQGLDVALEPNLVLQRVTATNIVNQSASAGGTPISTTGTLQTTATAGPPNPTP
jgi:hypothetical protein